MMRGSAEQLALATMPLFCDRRLPENGVRVRQTALFRGTGSEVPGWLEEKYAPVNDVGVVWEDGQGRFLFLGNDGQRVAWCDVWEGEWLNRYTVGVTETVMGNYRLHEATTTNDRQDLRVSVAAHYVGERLKCMSIVMDVAIGGGYEVTMVAEENQYHQVQYEGEVDMGTVVDELCRVDKKTGWDGVLMAAVGPVVQVCKQGKKPLELIIWDRASWGRRLAKPYGKMWLAGSLKVRELQTSLQEMTEGALVGLDGVTPLVISCGAKFNGNWGLNNG